MISCPLLCESQIFSCAIVGAGPIGIELAVAFKERCIDYIHFEAGPIASTIHWYAPGTVFFSSPERIAISGAPLETINQGKANREEYLQYLRAIVRQHKLSIHTYTRVTNIQKKEDETFELTTQRSFHGVGGPLENHTVSLGKECYTTRVRSIVLAIGDMHRPNLLEIPGESLPHVSHYFSDPHLYMGGKVLIVGSHNSAAEAMIRLRRLGISVALSHRHPAFVLDRIKPWLIPEIRNLIDRKEVEYHPNTQLIECRERSVVLKEINEPSSLKELPSIDHVLLLTGYRQDPTLFQMARVETIGDHQAPTYDPTTMETNIPGIFVAGTGCAGTQYGSHKHFIETSHVHVERIIAALQGQHVLIPTPVYEHPES